MQVCYILIIVGFFQIGIGLSIWAHTHVIRKDYKHTETLVRDLEGNQLEVWYGTSFYEDYKIVKKETLDGHNNDN